MSIWLSRDSGLYMSETDDFFILNYEDKLVLVLNSTNTGIKQLYLPGCDSFNNISRQIAIETDIFKNQHIVDNKFSEKSADTFKIDSGDLIIQSKSRYKIKFKLLGKSFDRVYVMIMPSWGRWTNKQIWLIISSK